MNQLFYAPIIAALLLGTVVQLEDLGEQASERTLQYAEDAVAAMDCAYEARPITDCAPGITSPDFAVEIEEANRLLKEVRKQSSGQSHTP